MTVGFLSVATHPREASIARVRVDGVDVTTRCYAADDEHGFADCFALDVVGLKYVVNGVVARQRLMGHVVIDFPNGLD